MNPSILPKILKTTRQSSRLTKLAYTGIAIAMAQSLSFGSVILTNGGFENGPTKAYNYTVAGWTTTLDGTYWAMMTTTSPAPTGSAFSAGYVADDTYAIRRSIFSGQGVAKISFQSIEYTLGDFSLASGDQIELSLKARSQGQAGRFETYGTLSFFDSTHTLIGTALQTTAAISSTTSAWSSVSLEAFIPDGAVYFKIAGVINVTEALTSAAYGGFDSFTLVQVPEPSAAVLLIPALAAGTLIYRRRSSKS